MAGQVLEVFRRRDGHSMDFEVAESRNKAKKHPSNLPIKHGRVFHHTDVASLLVKLLGICQCDSYLLLLQCLDIFPKGIMQVTQSHSFQRDLGNRNLAHSAASAWNVGGYMQGSPLHELLNSKKQIDFHRYPIKIQTNQSSLERLIRLN